MITTPTFAVAKIGHSRDIVPCNPKVEVITVPQFRLDVGDAIELVEILQVLSDWLDSDPEPSATDSREGCRIRNTGNSAISRSRSTG